MTAKRREGGMLIAKIHQVAGRIFAKKLKEYGIDEINPAQGRILFTLWVQDGIPIRELSEKTQLEKSTLTSMLDRLEAAGYVARVPSKSDRREILIRRTEKDRAFQQLYHEVSEDMTQLFYCGLADDEIDQFERCLNRIMDNLTGYENGCDR